LQKKISKAANKALVGREFQVLIEGPSADSDLVWQARLPSQAPEIDGVCYITDPGEFPLTAGEFRRMKITKAHDYDLSGELVDVPQSAFPRLVSIQPSLSAR
jgi:ribosomal protein S12 methylthiotransferase